MESVTSTGPWPALATARRRSGWAARPAPAGLTAFGSPAVWPPSTCAWPNGWPTRTRTSSVRTRSAISSRPSSSKGNSRKSTRQSGRFTVHRPPANRSASPRCGLTVTILHPRDGKSSSNGSTNVIHPNESSRRFQFRWLLVARGNDKFRESQVCGLSTINNHPSTKFQSVGLFKNGPVLDRLSQINPSTISYRPPASAISSVTISTSNNQPSAGGQVSMSDPTDFSKTVRFWTDYQSHPLNNQPTCARSAHSTLNHQQSTLNQAVPSPPLSRTQTRIMNHES